MGDGGPRFILALNPPTPAAHRAYAVLTLAPDVTHAQAIERLRSGLAERFPALKTANRRYVEVDLGGQRGKVVRLLVGGFPERAEALAYCRSLRGTALYCAPHDLPAG